MKYTLLICDTIATCIVPTVPTLVVATNCYDCDLPWGGYQATIMYYWEKNVLWYYTGSFS